MKCIILLATYNGESYIKDQLDSILNQKGVQIKVLVSDDLSTDNTLKIIKSYNDSRIHILPNYQKFGSASQNFFRLVRDANFDDFDYVSFADQDDIWNLDKLKNSISTIISKNADAYSSNVLAFWENGKSLVVNKAQNIKKYDHFFSSAGPGCTYVFKKSLAIQFQNELNAKNKLIKKIDFHDWLIYSYARVHKFKWCIDDSITMKYRQHQNNQFGANSGIKTYVKRWKESRNGWFRNQIIYGAQFCDYSAYPICVLKKNKLFGRLILIKDIFKFRRKKSEAIFIAFIFLTPGFK